MNPKKSRERSAGSDAMPRLRMRFLPAWALMAVTLAGCQLLPPATVDSTRFFVLAGAAGAGRGPEKTGGNLQIGLRLVTLPAYLRATKSMVVRDGANEIRYQDYSRWAEPLEAGVNRILEERLLASPEVRGVDVHPLRGDVARDYEVSVRVLECEGIAGESGVARFSASYEIAAADGGGIVASRTFTAPEAAWDGKDFGALAKLLSDGVSGLGDRIAADLPKK